MLVAVSAAFALSSVGLLKNDSFSAAILTYHDMVERRDQNALWFDCTPDELRSQIKWIKQKGFRFVSLDEIWKAVRNQTRFSNPTIAVTFADNYEGFYRLAWPILKAEKIPVTMFVHTGHVGSRKGRPKMSWEQLNVLGRSLLFTVSSQTVSHPSDITKLTDVKVKFEMEASAQELKKYCRSDPNVFLRPYIAYPNGKFDKRVSTIARKAGYRAGFTEEQMTIEKAPDIMRIPRYVHTKYKQASADVLASRQRNR